MSQITLKPLDDGQKAVEIPLGKTTIGRGPFLGVRINIRTCYLSIRVSFHGGNSFAGK